VVEGRFLDNVDPEEVPFGAIILDTSTYCNYTWDLLDRWQ